MTLIVRGLAVSADLAEGCSSRMILDPESWMDLRRFRSLHASGVSIAEIARETGHHWRTVKKYLNEDGPGVPPSAPPRVGTQPRVIEPFVAVIEAWLRSDVTLRGSVIHERLVAEHGFSGSYQRVKMFLAEARPAIAAELGDADDSPLTGLHRRVRGGARCAGSGRLG
jgi:hypothetical protein